MSRIHRAYEAILARKLKLLGARRVEQGVAWLQHKAARNSQAQGLSVADTLTQISRDLSLRTRCRQPLLPAQSQFICDAGLGGLARWLRAAGHDAFWQIDISDDQLLHTARDTRGVILTTDSLLLERAVLRDGLLPVLWLPPTLRIPEQLSLVFAEFGLEIRPARCMRCGGELLQVSKESLAGRVPPRTYRWLEEYFECSRCGQLFWHGTHWQRIRQELQRLSKREQARFNLLA